MAINAKQLLDEARLTVPELSAEQAHQELDQGSLDVLLDVRDAGEWEREHVDRATHAPRGLLEWLADPSYPKHEPALAGRTDARIVVLCASGGRSLLAAKTLREMGYRDVRSMTGGINAWKDGGLPVTSGADA